MELFDDPPVDATWVTPNRRLSATLLKNYNQFQLKQNQTSWRTLDILPFNSWIERLWQEHALDSLTAIIHRLRPEEEMFLWEDIIRQTPFSNILLQVSGAADLAKSAWGILKQWQVTIDHTSFQLSEDCAVFQQWAQQFQRVCQKNGWLDSHSLLDFLSEQVEEKIIPLPADIIFIGFNDFTPQQKKWQAVCHKQGSRIQFRDPLKKNNFDHAYRISMLDKECELLTMARWAKALLEKKPVTIGCIIPNLEIIRDQVIRVFSNVFSENNKYSQDLTSLPFNISAGKSLISYPVIHCVFELLELSLNAIPLETLSHLLRSPYLGDAETEFSARHEFDHRLRYTNRYALTLSQLLSVSQEKCPKLAKRLAHFHEKVSKNKNTSSFWAAHFMESLRLLGWPGERTLNSFEYQVVERFIEMLNEFSTYDAILPPLSYPAALRYLKRLVTKIIFQPETQDAPIQILGLLEAAGLAFDNTWVMGMDDMNWPEPLRPNPFIPAVLQKEYLMPHATHTRELQYSTQLITQLKQGADYIIFSHAKHNVDCELRASRLICDLPEISVENIPQSHFVSPFEIIFNTRKMESFIDDKAPAITVNTEIRGGITLFKQQAACPFKAFAEVRLNAYALKTPTLGINSLDRGIILHKSLELIWEKISDSKALINLHEIELKGIIDVSINEAIVKTLKHFQPPTGYIKLFTRHLQTTLWNWFNFEKSRPYFKVIAREKEYAATLGPVSFTLRLDRIDELENGKQLIIDYKSGKYNFLSHWFGDRPREPQLPLYCILDPYDKEGIAFAEFTTSNIGLKGISRENVEIKNIKKLDQTHYTENPDWETQIQTWKKTFEQLAEDFYSGMAAVDPRDQETCRSCELSLFCRVNQ